VTEWSLAEQEATRSSNVWGDCERDINITRQNALGTSERSGRWSTHSFPSDRRPSNIPASFLGIPVSVKSQMVLLDLTKSKALTKANMINDVKRNRLG
jgi:hypothetical protein